MTDSQQVAAYKFEGEWKAWNTQSLSKKQCSKLITWACRLYDIPVPSLGVAKRGRTVLRAGWVTVYDPEDHSILLSPQHMNPAICLHETAHAIHSVIAGDEAHEAHGAEWLALYLYLLHRAGLAPRIALFASARAWNLKWKDLDKHNPVRIRKTYAALRRKEKLDT